MNVLGMRNAAAFGAQPDVADFASKVALNPARVPPEHPGSRAGRGPRGARARWSGPGVARLAELSGLAVQQPA